MSVSFNTLQPATCRYSTGNLLDYGSMRQLEAGPAATTHSGIIAPLSADPRILNKVFIRCSSDPNFVETLEYRTVAAPNGPFPRIGSIWWGNHVFGTKPDQAKGIQLYLAPALSAEQARAIRDLNPDVIIVNPNVNAVDTISHGPNIPDNYYLKDTEGNRIEVWPGSYRLNLTKPEVAELLARFAYQQLLEGHLAFDGIFFDNFFTSISWMQADYLGHLIQIDANGDGLSDAPVALDAAWRAGVYHEVATFRKLAPYAYVSGHVGQIPPDDASLAAFDGTSFVFNAVNVREGVMPFDSLWQAYHSWFAGGSRTHITMMQSSPPNQFAYGYGYTPAQAMPPATAAFAQSFYPNMRFGLALALMNDGYSTFDFGDNTSATNFWYDEYDFNLGYPLGSAVRLGSGNPINPANLIHNGGFENDLQGWQFLVFNDGQARATAVADRVIKAAGDSSAHVTVASPGALTWHIDLEQPNISLTAQTSYQLQFWARADSPRTITVHTQGGAPNFSGYGLFSQIPISTSWSLHTASFTATLTANDGRLEFWFGDVAGNVWIDDVQLTPVPANANIYRRDFSHGIVLLNGTMSQQTIQLEPGFQRFSGTQAPLYQYIVDDSSPDLEVQGSWKTVTFDTGVPNSLGLLTSSVEATGPFYHAWQTTCHQLDSSSGTAQWTLTVPEDGEYTIQAWLPAAPSAKTWTQNAIYEVVSGRSVVASAAIDQSAASVGDGWHTIAAKVKLTSAGSAFLRVHNDGPGSLIADAIYVTSAALYNDGSSASQVTLAPMDSILLRRQQPIIPTTFTIADRGGTSSVSSGASVSVSVGYASIRPDVGRNAPSGLAILGFRQNNILVTEAGVPASPPIQAGRIYAELNGPVNTGLAMANPNSQTALVTFFFTDANGDFGNGSMTIPANGQIAAFLDQAPFNRRSLLSGSFTFNSSIPISVIGLRGFTNERSEFIITTLPVADLSAPAPPGPIVFPHFAEGGGWTTEIALVNTTDSVLTGSVQFRDQSGQATDLSVNGQTNSSFSYSISARSSQKLQTSGKGSSIVSGSVRVVPAGNGLAPSGVAIFSFHKDGKTVAEAGVPASPAGNAFRLYAEALGDFSHSAVGSIQSGLAIANNSASAGTVTLELSKLDGSSAGLTGTLQVPPNGQRATFLNQIQGFASLQMPFQGVLRVSSAASISIVGLRGRYNERGDFLITTTPPVNEAATASSSALFLPQIADGGGYTTQFIILSPQAGQTSSGTLQLLSQSGGNLNLTLR